MLFYTIPVFITAFIITVFAIKKIIYISIKKQLFDEPGENRKIHHSRTPNLGGIAIFIAFIFTNLLFPSFSNIAHLNYLVAASLIIFILGVTDDLVALNPYKKFGGQILVALITIVAANIKITNLHGLLGIYQLSALASIVLSLLFFLLIINAFNLIDGINCLSASLGLLAFLTFAFLFQKMQAPNLLLMAIAMCGSLLAFIYFNRTPAKIFMGDTGSLFIGFLISVFSIFFIEHDKTSIQALHNELFNIAPAFIFALLIIPIFDTTRVFVLRIIQGKSPFHADRNHLHHRLIDLRFTHMQATCILLCVTLIALLIVYFFKYMQTNSLLFILVSYILLLNWFSYIIHSHKIKKQVNTLIDTSTSLLANPHHTSITIIDVLPEEALMQSMKKKSLLVG